MNEGGDNFSTKRSMKKAPPHGNPSKRASGSARAGPRSDSPGREIDYSSPKGSVPPPMMRSQNEGEVQTSTGRNTGEEKVASASSVDQAGLKKGDSPSQDEKPRAKLSKTDDVMVRGSFPEKLMALLERKTAPSAIWWLPDNVNAKGTFAINKSRFEDDISQIFNGNKWSSIARNLNRWGFRPVSYPGLPPRTTAYYNPFFQRGQKELLKTVSDKKSQCKATIQEMEQAAAAEERKIGSPVAAPTQSLISAVVAPNQRALSSPYRQGGNASASASAAVNSSIFAAHNAATVPYSRDFSSLVAAASSGAPYPTLDTAFTSSRAAASLGAGVSLSGNLLQTALLDQQRRQQDLQLQQEIHLLGLRQQQQQDLRDFEQRQYLRQQVQQRLHQELLLQHREQEEIQLLHRKQELARQVAMQRQALDLLQSRQRLGAPTESHSQALASSREELERLVQQQQAVIDELLLREAARRRRSGGSS